MNRITKAFAAISRISRNPWLLNKVLDDDIYWRNQVKRQLYQHDGFPVISPVHLFGDFNETIDPFAFMDGGSLPTDLALIKKLARSFERCDYFEIGTWRGESVANAASVARNCTTFNLSAREMASMGLDAEYINQHGMFSKNLPNVRHLEGNSLGYDFGSLNSKFDLIFIDGDHHFDMVKNDTEKVFKHLVHDRSIVVWHDYARNPETVRYEVMAGILAGCPVRLHPKLFHVAHTLCAVMLPEKPAGLKPMTNLRPGGAFSIDIRYNLI